MILYEKAKTIIQKAGQEHNCGMEFVATQDSVGRTVAKDLYAPIDIQPFDNSAMDGFAVRRSDLGSDGGVLIKIGVIAAGDAVPEGNVLEGQCIEIMTGAPAPPWAEAVVPVELVEVKGDEVHFKALPGLGANIRRAGEDFKKGMEVIKAGQYIHPQHIMPLAALGVDEVEVYKKPRAVFLATGSELVEDLSQNLKSGQIYNSNRPYGLVALEEMGVEPVAVPTMPDNLDHFEAFLKDIMLQDIDLIISSGAVSAGKYDFVRKGLEQVGAEILFHRVKIKPGKPNLFARLPNGTLYFGLPGNPVATTAGLRFFVQPCLRSMMGMAEEKPVQARVNSYFKKRPGLRVFLKAKVEACQDGVLGVELLEGQESFMVRPFLDMNCWAVVAEDVEEVKVGDMVALYPLYPHAGFL